MKPKLSLVLPMYNVEQYIARCLDSIYANPESASEIEVLIIDDGSPDRSAIVAQQWIDSRGVTNARIIQQENRGLGGARNTGIREASSPWIWFIDSDDEITSDAILNILSRLNPTLDFITFEFLRIPQNSLGYGLTKEYNQIPPDVLANQIVLNSPCFNIYQVDFLKEQNLYFREKFLHEDNEFAIRVNFRARQIAYFPIVIYKYYTTNGDSITNTLSPHKVPNLLSHFDTYNELLKQSPSKQQKKAMQVINKVPLAWLLNALKFGTKQERRTTGLLIKHNRARLRQSISMLPLKLKLKVWIQTSSIYIFLISTCRRSSVDETR